MNYFKLGLCSVTFRKKTAEEVVEIAKKAGVDYIEWGADVHIKTAEDAQKAKELNVTLADLETVFKECDVISNHLANKKELKNIFDSKYFKLMKKV